MATTTYFGWETPDDTDLVKDGAAAIRTLGSAIDSSMSQLEGGTTGQILSKTSATDMAFTWIANDQGDITAVTAGTGISGGGTSGAVTVTNSMATAIDAKGDLIVGTGADAFSRLAVGATNGQVLTVDSAEATGLKYATPGGSTKSYTLLNAGGTALTAAATITVTGVTGDDLLVLVTSASSASASSPIYIRFNTIATANYGNMGITDVGASTYAASNLGRVSNAVNGATVIAFATTSSDAASNVAGYCRVFGAKSTGSKPYIYAAGANAATGNGQVTGTAGGVFTDTSAISSVSIISGTGDFDNGTIYVYEAQ